MSECDVILSKLEYKLIEEIKATYLINVLREKLRN